MFITMNAARSPSMYSFFVVLIVLSSATCCWSWDSNDMQMFDLVEELKDKNFYDFLNVSKTASSGEIRRAYRRLSLVHHPDKNADNPEANKIFQRIVAVYEILKDSKLREKYDEVLKNGLPTWRQPVYYYRKLRKMGIAETLLLIFVITIIGHYFVMWGYYLEYKLNMEDFLNSKRKKAPKKQKDVVENAIQEELSTIPRPRFIDIWPIALVRGTYHFIISIPFLCAEGKKLITSQVNAYFEEKRKAKEEKEALEQLEKDRELKKELKKKRKKEKAEQIRSAQVPVTGDAPVVYNPAFSFRDDDDEKPSEMKSGPWTDVDYVMLTKAMVRFPPGVAERWQRIADKLGRSVDDVTSKAKAMRENGGMPMSETVQNSVDGFQMNVLNGRVDGGITLREPIFEVVQNEVCGSSSEEEEDEYESARQRRQAKRRKKRQTIQTQAEPSSEMETVEEVSVKEKEPAKQPEMVFPESVQTWSQEEQRALEAALRKFPKGTHERWERIASFVRTRSKIECMDRFRFLTTVVKSKTQ